MANQTTLEDHEQLEIDDDEWPDAVEYLREHYDDSYQARVELAADLRRFGDDAGVEVPQAAGTEAATQPLIRYQNVDPDDVPAQMQLSLETPTTKQIQHLVVEFAAAGAARYDDAGGDE